MSAFFLMTIAILLLGISVYSLLSYIKERRAKRFRPFRQR
ncbi:small membrane protein [Klebsiella huaxiensis]